MIRSRTFGTIAVRGFQASSLQLPGQTSVCTAGLATARFCIRSLRREDLGAFVGNGGHLSVRAQGVFLLFCYLAVSVTCGVYCIQKISWVCNECSGCREWLCVQTHQPAGSPGGLSETMRGWKLALGDFGHIVTQDDAGKTETHCLGARSCGVIVYAPLETRGHLKKLCVQESPQRLKFP